VAYQVTFYATCEYLVTAWSTSVSELKTDTEFPAESAVFPRECGPIITTNIDNYCMPEHREV